MEYSKCNELVKCRVCKLSNVERNIGVTSLGIFTEKTFWWLGDDGKVMKKLDMKHSKFPFME